MNPPTSAANLSYWHLFVMLLIDNVTNAVDR